MYRCISCFGHQQPSLWLGNTRAVALRFLFQSPFLSGFCGRFFETVKWPPTIGDQKVMAGAASFAKNLVWFPWCAKNWDISSNLWTNLMGQFFSWVKTRKYCCDGSEILRSPVEVGIVCLIIHEVLYMPGTVQDFWNINSIPELALDCNWLLIWTNAKQRLPSKKLGEFWFVILMLYCRSVCENP